MQASGERLSIPLRPKQEGTSEVEISLPTRMRLLKGGALFGVSQFLGMALGFLSGMVMVRVADKPAVASYMLLQQAIMALGMALQLGLGAAALRFTPLSRGQGGERTTALLRRRLLGLQVFLWGLVVPPLALAWPAISRKLDAPELAGATAFLVAAAVLASFGNLVDSYLRSFRLYSLSAPLTHLVPRGLILGGFLLLLLRHGGREPWEMLAAIYVGAMLITSLGYALALATTTPGESSEPRAANVPPGYREILGTSTAMGLRSAASVLFVSSSLWVLSWARPHEDVAVYGVAATLLQVMAAIPSIANFVIPQELAVLQVDGRKKEMERLARTAATLVAILSGRLPRRPAAPRPPSDPDGLRRFLRGRLGHPPDSCSGQLLGLRLRQRRLRAPDGGAPRAAVAPDPRRGGPQRGAEPGAGAGLGRLRHRPRHHGDAYRPEPRHGRLGAPAGRHPHLRLHPARSMEAGPANGT